jgi:N-6 DNA Methylase
MPDFDKIRDLEWLGHVQPVGLVVSPRVLAELGLAPAYQTPADTEQAAALLGPENGPALPDAWAFMRDILGWPADRVAGAPGGPPIQDAPRIDVAESTTVLEPHLAVVKPGGGWQLLVRIESAGIEPEKRGALAGWEATPHQRFERLLRETGVQTGVLITDAELRLIHAPRGETSGWLGFPLRPLGTVSGRPMLSGLKLLLNRRRLFTDAENARLPALLAESRRAQATVSTQLATQVLGALYELLRGLHAAEPERIAVLARTQSQHLYEGLLTVLLRLVFLLYAEDRDLIPSRADRIARDFYDQGYGVRRLHSRLLEDAARFPDTMDERRGAWGGLLALFRLVHTGDGTHWIRGRGGKLFDPVAFPFLQGQTAPGDLPRVPPMSDGGILRILNLLLTLDGERLSYRTLDVEQIGSVYETVMGFTVTAMPGPALAIKAGRNNRTPVFVDLADLLRKRGADRLKSLKEDANRSGTLSARQAQPVTAATTEAALGAALAPLVDERGSPRAHVWPPGTPLLQPTDERRRTGSHYTPRELTNPIVEHALAPAFERLGEDATPEQVLSLKVCDPAMGSGAFLVEACRQIAGRLVRAWARHSGTRPEIAADEDEDLLARRLVAQRCLYGVDKNPMAVDLARLSLWLATLARDHEFSFLDHALKAGDSLVGLSRERIGALRWDAEPRQGSLFSGLVRERVGEALAGREDIRAAPDDVERAMQESRFVTVERRLDPVRQIGDAVVAAFLDEDRPRAREARRRALEDAAAWDTDTAWATICTMSAHIRQNASAVHPFHWELEFPEVFSDLVPGFDGVVGNPPFLGGTAISERHGMPYFQFLVSQFEGTGHHCDLVAYFFRRAFDLLKVGGCFGLVASNTIAQGDTREGGLLELVRRGGSIARAIRRYPWPGEAAVVTSIVHVSKGRLGDSPILDGNKVSRISPFLIAGDVNDSPARLSMNPYFSLGSKIYGQGFVFDDRDPKANKIEVMNDLTLKADVSRRIKSYIGGEDLNDVPLLVARRFVIDVNDIADEVGLNSVPQIRDLLLEKVKPERMMLGANPNNVPLKQYWWRYQAHRPKLYGLLNSSKFAVAISRISKHVAFAICGTDVVFSEQVVVIPANEYAIFSSLQSRIHEAWARFFASSMKDDLRYTPSDCFETFPFPPRVSALSELSEAGCAYVRERVALMTARNEGMTRLYNRFHNPGETTPDVEHLRTLHHSLDQTVLRAYGWNDLADSAAPQFLDEKNEEDHRYQDRLFWPSAFREEVLTRLLALNAERAAAERAAGLAVQPITADAYATESEDAV